MNDNDYLARLWVPENALEPENEHALQAAIDAVKRLDDSHWYLEDYAQLMTSADWRQFRHAMKNYFIAVNGQPREITAEFVPGNTNADVVVFKKPLVQDGEEATASTEPTMGDIASAAAALAESLRTLKECVEVLRETVREGNVAWERFNHTPKGMTKEVFDAAVNRVLYGVYVGTRIGSDDEETE